MYSLFSHNAYKYKVPQVFIGKNTINRMRIILNERQLAALRKSDVLSEDVFVSNIDNKKKRLGLSYLKGGSAIRRNKYKGESLKTDKMDSVGSDTYEVPLKNGMMSYNITSINGTEVMHYFKNHFNKKKTSAKVDGEEYELVMEDAEFREFMEQFINKVGYVVSSKTEEMDIDDGRYLSIFPVPSSSNFNETMVEVMSRNRIKVNGLITRKVDGDVLRKDVSNIEKDENFVQNNKDFYDAPYSSYDKFGEGAKEYKGTNMNQLDNEINRFGRLEDIKAQIEILNAMTENRRGKSKGRLLTIWNNIKSGIAAGQKIRQSTIKKLDDLFTEYQEGVEKLRDIARYYDTARGQDNAQHLEKVAQAIKYAKGPSIERRKNEILEYLRENGFGKRINKAKLYDVCMWEPANFEIKKLSNGTRLGMKNLFAFDDEKLKKEIDAIKNSVLVIFDDNISGGATLSDICYQFKKLGIENIIPITFGKMKVKNMMGTTMPNHKFNMT